jgi:hypothetical protein
VKRNNYMTEFKLELAKQFTEKGPLALERGGVSIGPSKDVSFL